MVLIGGITRLTDSGLSMSTWKLIGGAPPLNIEEWTAAFEIYKKTPEGKVNSHYILDDFKSIFFWEYLHRMMGRLLGVVFLIPFIYFLIKKQLSRKLILQSIILLSMGLSQGLIGWWMVQSGLIDKPDVSHFRLAIHLIIAFLTCSYTLWVALPLISPSSKEGNKIIFNRLLLLSILAIIQIIYGAFVAGLKAGRIYNTWPKMGEEWIPESVFLDPGAEAQFIHRTLALIILSFTFYIWYKSKKITLSKLQKNSLYALLLIVSLQIVLGISTLIMIVPISLALIHQIVAFFLLLLLVFNLFLFKKS
tara:strand:- start:10606 stop:11523 length:918 start_codon:yes stop_codon:yes gene_type:complete